MKLKKIKNQLKTLKKFRFLVSCLIYDESRYYFIRSTYYFKEIRSIPVFVYSLREDGKIF